MLYLKKTILIFWQLFACPALERVNVPVYLYIICFTRSWNIWSIIIIIMFWLFVIWFLFRLGAVNFAALYKDKYSWLPLLRLDKVSYKHKRNI